MDDRDIDKIVYKLRIALRDDLKKMIQKEQPPEMVDTAEAAAILRISPRRMRQIADRYPHTKIGDSKQGRLLFIRSALLN